MAYPPAIEVPAVLFNLGERVVPPIGFRLDEAILGLHPHMVYNGTKLVKLTYVSENLFTGPTISPFGTTIFGKFKDIGWWIAFDNDRETYIGFRGTTSLVDTIGTNFNALPSYLAGRRLHSGFSANMVEVFEDLLPHIEVRLARADHVLIIAGHSMGGARAHCLHYHLAMLPEYRRYNVVSIGFGSPYFGCNRIQEDIDRIGRRDKFITIANKGDPILGILDLDASFDVVRNPARRLREIAQEVQNLATVRNEAGSSLVLPLGLPRAMEVLQRYFMRQCSYYPAGTYLFILQDGSGLIVRNPQRILQHCRWTPEILNPGAMSLHSLTNGYQSGLMYIDCLYDVFQANGISVLFPVTPTRVWVAHTVAFVEKHEAMVARSKLTRIDKKLRDFYKDYLRLFYGCLDVLIRMHTFWTIARTNLPRLNAQGQHTNTVRESLNEWLTEKRRNYRREFVQQSGTLGEHKLSLTNSKDALKNHTLELNKDDWTIATTNCGKIASGAVGVVGVGAFVLLWPSTPLAIAISVASFSSFVKFDNLESGIVSREFGENATQDVMALSKCMYRVVNQSDQIFIAWSNLLSSEEEATSISVENWTSIFEDIDVVIQELNKFVDVNQGIERERL
ncbi:hypothetical protein HDU79_005207 [Rhizoclosmatium sp. JEL0117]|nr:hypothetical protein HDU79_005207 [Rhizoclosmatium sp. JEL0117]